MTDPYANFLMGKLISSLPPATHASLVKALQPNLFTLALNQHGNHAMQKLVGSSTTTEEIDIIAGVFLAADSFSRASLDSHGHYVIERVVEKINKAQLKGVVEALHKDAVGYCTSSNGNYVYKAAITASDGEMRESLIAAVVKHASELARDKFGNYVIQHIVDISETIADRVALSLLKDTVELACNKCSCNVIRKLLQKCGLDVRRQMTQEMLLPEALPKLMQDGLGNFAVQEALVVLSTTDQAQHKIASDTVRQFLHLIPHWQRNFEAKMLTVDGQMPPPQQMPQRDHSQRGRGRGGRGGGHHNNHQQQQ